jgi:dCMP deaminase
MNSSENEALIAYVATPHAGYLKLFRKYAGRVLYVLGEDLIQQFPSLVRHLPGVTPHEAQKMIKALGIFTDVRILTPADISTVQRATRIIMPDEDVTHVLAANYFEDTKVVYDGTWRLRWDWGAVTKARVPEGEQVISVGELDRELMLRAFSIADKSPNWWRQIGAFLAKDGEILLTAFNQDVPHDQSAYCYGDPRSVLSPPGSRLEITGSLHAEMAILAEVARRGISTQGCDLGVTTFPCPSCAFPWAFTGIKRLFYADGYSLVAGAETFQSRGVEIIRVKM